MAQHFLLTSAARTLSLASVMRMSDEEVELVFIRLRWADYTVRAPDWLIPMNCFWKCS
jgi:hypothetical protein